MNNTNFIAIDFETATPQRAACQIGIVIVKEGKIIKKISRLIQPPKNKYSNICMEVHKITPSMTVNSPTFNILWEEIKEYFEGNFIVAHNAAFDLDVLYKSLDTYNIPHPIFMGTACTYQLSKMSLEDACNQYNISLCNHHDSIYDAEACALLFLKYLDGEFTNKSLIHNSKKLEASNTANEIKTDSSQILHKTFNSLKYEHFLEECSADDPLTCLSDDLLLSLCPHPNFINKKFIITGGTIFDRNRAYLIIEKLGGKKTATINKTLDYVILGKEPGPKKIEQIKNLKDEGYSICVINDNEFIELVKISIKKYEK